MAPAGARRGDGVDLVAMPQDDVPAQYGRQVAALNAAAWPGLPGLRDWRHDPLLEPWCVLLLEKSTVVASLAVLSKEIEHGGVRFRASGLSAVVTHPSRRGEGLGRRLTDSARELMAERGADLGIFTCDRDLVAFYVAGGWQVLVDTALVGGTVDDPLVSSDLNKITMAAFFTPRARAYEQSFHGARVLLYSGTQDRLW